VADDAYVYGHDAGGMFVGDLGVDIRIFLGVIAKQYKSLHRENLEYSPHPIAFPAMCCVADL
jgi:hypothetical protein